MANLSRVLSASSAVLVAPQSFASSERVISMTLSLFKDLTAGYMSGKLLSKLDASSFLLQNHGPQTYTFLSSLANARNRTLYYATIARMIFVEDSAAKFKAFVAPLQQVLEHVAQASGGGEHAGQLRSAIAAETASGLFRDLHGIAQATVSRRDYMVLFDWLYPQHFPAICAALQAWADVPLVTTPLLKFIVEFVSNKGQCMVFESSSANGILLFREISRMLTIYSGSVLQVRPCASSCLLSVSVARSVTSSCTTIIGRQSGLQTCELR
jgi:exportin-7